MGFFVGGSVNPTDPRKQGLLCLWGNHGSRCRCARALFTDFVGDNYHLHSTGKCNPSLFFSFQITEAEIKVRACSSALKNEKRKKERKCAFSNRITNAVEYCRRHCIFAAVQSICCKRQLHTCCMPGVSTVCLNLNSFACVDLNKNDLYYIFIDWIILVLILHNLNASKTCK